MIRSSVKLIFMNYGCAFSDFLGRKPIVLFFILPNMLMDIMLIIGPIQPSVVYIMGLLWGLNSITIPTLRAWVTDLTLDRNEVINALGAFRGFSIGISTMIGIPLGAALAASNNITIAFYSSLFANIIAFVIILLTQLDDTLGLHKTSTIMLTGSNPIQKEEFPSNTTTSSNTSMRDLYARATVFKYVDWSQFLIKYSPLSGYHIILEKSSPLPQIWLSYFLTSCASEVSGW